VGNVSAVAVVAGSRGSKYPINAPAPEAGQALARHMDVAKLAFTGSGPTGRKMLQYAAESELTRSRCIFDTNGPIIVLGSNGSPTINSSINLLILGLN
jgi:acyl-CoA reductase-like NAD-dependent aldehyde dehydrogenase